MATKPKLWWTIWRWELHWQILVGLAVGIVLALLISRAVRHDALMDSAREYLQPGYSKLKPAEQREAREKIDAKAAEIVAAVNAPESDEAKKLISEEGEPKLINKIKDGARGQVSANLSGRVDFMVLDLLGDMFMNALKMIIVPIVMSSLITSVASMGSTAGFARLGGKTLLYYLSTSALAIMTGLLLVNLIVPGVADSSKGALLVKDDQRLGDFTEEVGKVADKQDQKASDFLDVFRKMIPSNIFNAASDNGQLLGLIVVSLLIGFFMTKLGGQPSEVMFGFWKAVYDLILGITHLVLSLAPIGIAGLLAATLSEQIPTLMLDQRLDEFVQVIVQFFFTVVGALGVHMFVTMPIILLLVGRVAPWRHYQAMTPAMLTAFSTASSSATLPVTLDCVENRAGVSNRVASFTLPLGATVNMDGTALYECVAVMFVAQLYGIEMSFATQFMVVTLSLLTSIGVAGVPQASLVAIVVILNASGVPLEGLALILVVDRVLDMCRTATNIFSDSCGAVVIARSEGETNVLQPPRDDDDAEAEPKPVVPVS